MTPPGVVVAVAVAEPLPLWSVRRRREIEGRLERIRELYKWGELTREAYVADRDRLHAELSTVQTTSDRASLVTRAAAFLRDLPAAWSTATPDQRNALARLIFQKVEIEDDRVAAVVPQPDFAPFFALAGGNETGWPDLATPDCQVLSLAGGSDGDRCRHRVMTLLAQHRSTSPRAPPRRHTDRCVGV
jgi:hypothetical protein